MTTLIPKHEQSATGAINRPISDKLSEIPSLNDFDTSANFNAYAATLTSPVNQAIQPQTTVRTLSSKLQESVSVKDFGAIGDGVTDDTVAIQAAIESVYTSSSESGWVLIPAGVYKISAALYLHQGVSIFGYGATLLAASTSVPDIIIIDNPTSPTAPTSFETHIHGLNIQGDNNTDRNVPRAIRFDSSCVCVEIMTIKDCIIKWFIKGIEFGNNIRLVSVSDTSIITKTYGAIATCNAGAFIGDFWFTNVQFENENSAAASVGLYCSGVNSQIAGWHFNHCVFYGNAFISENTSTGTGFIQDLFFDNVVNDGNAYTLTPGNVNWEFTNCNHVFFTSSWINTAANAMSFTGCYDIQFSGGKFSSVDNFAIKFINSAWSSVNNVTFQDCNRLQTSGAGIVNFSGTTGSFRCSATGCKVYNSVSAADTPIVLGVTDKCLVANCITDTTNVYSNAGTGNIFANNIPA